jgi:hypothetical protein
MRKSRMVFVILVFAVILVTLMINSIPALAFNKNGPTPIPGNLFPHPGTLPNDHSSKHLVEKLHLLQAMPKT